MWKTPQTYGRRYSGQMRLKLSFLAIKENTMSGTNLTPLITPRTPSCGDVFPSAGTGKLVRIERMVDGAKYREILGGNLFQSSRDLRMGPRFPFQQDNGPKNTANATLEWFMGKHLNVLEWPSQSPDLNPIESLRSDLKIAVHQPNTSILKELEQFYLEEWAKVLVARCAILIDKYPKRLGIDFGG
jgi:hypothetical protein